MRDEITHYTSLIACLILLLFKGRSTLVGSGQLDQSLQMDVSLLANWGLPNWPCFGRIQAFPFLPVTGDFRCLWRAQSPVIKWSLAVKFTYLALRWGLHTQIISTYKRLFASCFIWKETLWGTNLVMSSSFSLAEPTVWVSVLLALSDKWNASMGISLVRGHIAWKPRNSIQG